VHAEAIDDLRVRVTFANGEAGLFDVRPYLAYPAFAPLRDAAFFRRAHAVHGTVAWSEEIDLCSDTVWHEAVRDRGEAPLR
jgi:hypothetical protein